MEEHNKWFVGDDEVEGFVRDMSSLFVRDFVSDEKDKTIDNLGLGSPFAVVKFIKRNNEVIILNAYKKENELYVTSNKKPTLYLVDKIDTKKFNREAIFFRNKDILPFMSFNVKEITFFYRGYSFTIKKDGVNQWLLPTR